MNADDFTRVLFLQDHNTRVVVLGTALLGAAAGVVGVFALLRKRALIGDALSHATLPGVALAFIVAVSLGSVGKSQPILLLGATLSGLLGVAAVHAITRLTNLKPDAAMGIVLSVFYGAGVALLGVAQRLPNATSAGLEGFIYGKTAGMITADATLIASVALVVAAVVAVLYKELKLLTFDPGYAAARGYPVQTLEAVTFGLVVAVTVIGLQAVGLILVIALLIIPAAAARFWTDRLLPLLLLAAVIGAGSCITGSLASALVDHLPSGATIVLVSACLFFVSLLFGTARGLVPRLLERRSLSRRERLRHLLRAVHELTEPDHTDAVPIAAVARARAWNLGHLPRAVAAAVRQGLISPGTSHDLRLTAAGRIEAARLVREHRLWELYLVRHADIAPSHVDRDADAIEHVLSPVILAELEALLTPSPSTPSNLPPSPHPLNPGR
jgi:manganese/zinc/iron transport system permease protein